MYNTLRMHCLFLGDSNMTEKIWDKRRKRIFEIVEVGTQYDYVSRAYDLINALNIIANLVISILLTFEDYRARYLVLLTILEDITVVFFGSGLCFKTVDSKVPLP